VNPAAAKAPFISPAPRIVEDIHPDLSCELFAEALSRAFHEHATSVNGFAPPSGLGQVMYIFVTQSLREALSTLPGWHPSDQNNIARMVHSSSGVSIICSGGDENTGREAGMPSTRSTKGTGTAQLAGQLSMFDQSVPEACNKIWYFLYYVDLSKREIRCELSNPARIESGSAIDFWSHRVFLPAIPLEAAFAAVGFEATEEINIPIEIKKAV